MCHAQLPRVTCHITVPLSREPLLTFDLGVGVGDVSWSPYSSTVFAAVSQVPCHHTIAHSVLLCTYLIKCDV